MTSELKKLGFSKNKNHIIWRKLTSGYVQILTQDAVFVVQSRELFEDLTKCKFSELLVSTLIELRDEVLSYNTEDTFIIEYADKYSILVQRDKIANIVVTELGKLDYEKMGLTVLPDAETA